MKGRKGTKGGGRYAANILITLRVTVEEKTRLTEQAEIAGLSLSEYMRRRFFGGTIAVNDEFETSVPGVFSEAGLPPIRI
nr:hypothetical protein [uncultured Bilophila sp.]